MARSADLLGKRFGRLVVVEKLDQRQDRYQLWRCRCDCGGEILVNTKRLTRGTVTHCGCLPQTTARRGSRAEDLTGRRFGRLTVLNRVENRKGRTCWLCRCDCGGLCTATAHALKAGKVLGCGCQRGEHSSMADLTGQRFGRLTALFPTERRNKKGSVYWHCRCDCGGETEVTQDDLVRGNCQSCGCLKREVQQEIPNRLHHLDGTCVEWLEKRKHRRDNTSGFRGISSLKNGRFKATIGFKGQRFYLGTFPSFPEAVAARMEAEEILHQGFVDAYYRWKAANQGLPPERQSPFIFQAEQREGRFVVTTNIPLEQPQPLLLSASL